MQFPKFSAGDWVRLVFLVLFVLLVWFGAFSLSSGTVTAGKPLRITEHIGDLATALFGAASLALFAISIFIAFLAIFGWKAVEDTIRAEVAASNAELTAANAERLKTIENELRGRVFSLSGFVIGESCSDRPDPINQERLREAIHYCKHGYEILKTVPSSSAQFAALNNLLEYTCMLGETENRGRLLDEARKIRAAGEEHDVPNLLLTYCRAILTFGVESKDIDQACVMVGDLQRSPRLTTKEKREADELASRCVHRSGPTRSPLA